MPIVKMPSAVSHQPELDNLILNSDSGLRGTLGLCVQIQRRCNKVRQEILSSYSGGLQLNASV